MNPYQSLPPRSFWRTAVAEPAWADIDGLWTPKFAIGQDDVLLTAGSCFARHIGRALRDRGMNWRDTELAPPGLTPEQRRDRHFGVFSFRTGNIYTAAVLRQWFAWALGAEEPPEEVWQEDGRFHDPCRPAVEPAGYASAEELFAARAATLAAVREGLAEADCLIFTLGLTEAWRDRDGGTVHPVCPGTLRGTFDPERHVFHNFAFDEVRRDLTAALELARSANPGLKVLLTVSPVPLTATATGGHALAATTYSKSVLRAVAGQLAAEHAHIDYFPSYEIVTGTPFRGAFFEPNLRTVTPEGVAFVMDRFFGALDGRQAAAAPVSPPATDHSTAQPTAGEDFWCDDAVLDYYSPR
ncbi:GSCFA domain-containing protein [Streptomyces sp. NPDC021100]|uniref:GSCFA domain-containing protein n=1 Tax=Streptomyces sp. NPDC021100 TaxID=3365114 RepID=UPI00378A666A